MNPVGIMMLIVLSMCIIGFLVMGVDYTSTKVKDRKKQKQYNIAQEQKRIENAAFHKRQEEIHAKEQELYAQRLLSLQLSNQREIGRQNLLSSQQRRNSLHPNTCTPSGTRRSGRQSNNCRPSSTRRSVRQ